MLGIGITLDPMFCRADTLCRAVAALPFLRAVRRPSRASRNRCPRQMRLRPPLGMPCARRLVSCTRLARRFARSPMKPSRRSLHVADEPRRHELGVGVDRGPRPDIAVPTRPLSAGRSFPWHTERPNLIDLDALAGQIYERPILIFSECLSASATSLRPVFRLIPVIREIDRKETPSAIIWRIWARCSLVSRFILTNMLEININVNSHFHTKCESIIDR